MYFLRKYWFCVLTILSVNVSSSHAAFRYLRFVYLSKEPAPLLTGVNELRWRVGNVSYPTVPMTSNSTGALSTRASAQDASAYRAYDGNLADSASWGTFMTQNLPCTLDLDLGTSSSGWIMPDSIYVNVRAGSGRRITSFRCEGSIDNAAWTILAEVSNLLIGVGTYVIHLPGQALYWHGASSDAHLPANWTTDKAGTVRATALSSSDLLYFNGTGTNSSAPCSLKTKFSAHTIDFSGYSSALNFNSCSLFVHGDLVFSETMTIAGNVSLVFDGSGLQKFTPKRDFEFSSLKRKAPGTLVLQGGIPLRVRVLSIDASGRIDLGTIPITHTVWEVGTSGIYEFGLCTLKVNSRCNPKYAKFIGESGVLQLNGGGTSTYSLQGSWNGDILPHIIKTGSATYSFSEIGGNGLRCRSFTIEQGSVNFNKKLLDIRSGNFVINNGDSATLQNIDGSAIRVSGNALLNGKSDIPLRINPILACTLSVAGSLSASNASIGNCVASKSTGYADPISCVDLGGNTNWVFGAPVAITNLVYVSNPAVYTVGQPAVANTVTYSGSRADSFTISPALPAGLVIDKSKGTVSGTPGAISASAAYTVTATNAVGPATVVITISVASSTPRPGNITYATNPAYYTVGKVISPNTATVSGGAANSFSITPALPTGLLFNAANGTISGTPSAAQAPTEYVVRATNDAGTDSVIVSIAVNNANDIIVNPLVVTGSYVDATKAALRITGFSALPGAPTAPYVKYIGIWYRENSFPVSPDTNGAAVPFIRIPFDRAKSSGASFDTVVTLPPVSSADSSWYFSVAPVWFAVQFPPRDSVSPFDSRNGAKVIMRDTTTPPNDLTIAGLFRAPDSVIITVNNTSSIKTAAIDSVLFYFWFDSTQILRTISVASATVFAAAGGTYTVSIADPLFAIESALTSAVRLKGKNNLLSAAKQVSFQVGRKRPDNPIQLSAEALGSSRAILSWPELSAGSADTIRIWSGRTPIPFSHAIPDSFQFIDLPVTARLDTIAGLNPASEYHFGAQVRLDGLWSAVTSQSSASITTGKPDTTYRAPVPRIDSAWFDSSINALSVKWSIDSIGSKALVHAVTFSLNPAGIAEPQRNERITDATMTTSVRLGSSIVFDTVYHVAIWAKAEDGLWSVPGSAARRSVRVGSYSWQPVTYFATGDSIVGVFNGKAFLRRPAGWAWLYTDTIDIYKPSAHEGLIATGNGISFRSEDVGKSPKFQIGVTYDSIPSGYSAADMRIYRDSAGVFLVQDSTVLDEANSTLWINTSRLDLPFIAMIDIVPPVLDATGDLLSALPPGIAISQAVSVSDNIGNVKITWAYGKGGDRPAQVTKVLSGRSAIDSFSIPGNQVTEDNGLRVIVTVTDGRSSRSINLSRSVNRTASDPMATEEMQWVPLRVTAYLANADIQTCLDELADTDGSWKYDNRLFRIFRWASHASNQYDTVKWLEYSEENRNHFAIAPGQLFWLKTRYPKRVDFGPGTTTSLKDTVLVKVPPQGWADFGMPWKFEMKTGDILTATGADTGDLVLFQWINNDTMYRAKDLYVPFVAESEDYGADMTAGNRDGGYAAYNNGQDTITLRIPPIPSALSAFTSKLFRRSSDPAWAIRIDAATGRHQIGTAQLAVNNRAKRARMYPAPPSFSDVSIQIRDRSTKKLFGSIIQSRLENEGQSWEIVLSNRGKTPRQIDFRPSVLGSFPEAMKAMIVDLPSGEAWAIDPTVATTMSVMVSGSEQLSRQLVVGTQSYIDQLRRGKPVVSKTALLGAFPNPLRSTARIRYTIADKGMVRVRFSIIDAQGRLVGERKLSTVRAGTGTLLWEQLFASGVYILRMEALDQAGRVHRFEKRLVCLL